MTWTVDWTRFGRECGGGSGDGHEHGQGHGHEHGNGYVHRHGHGHGHGHENEYGPGLDIHVQKSSELRRLVKLLKDDSDIYEYHCREQRNSEVQTGNTAELYESSFSVSGI